jgi:hypothetical protein
MNKAVFTFLIFLANSYFDALDIDIYFLRSIPTEIKISCGYNY